MSNFKYPGIGSLESRVLARLLRAERLTHRSFDGESHTYRLAAYIGKLRGKGWPILTYYLPERTADPTGRFARYGIYYLPLSTIKRTGAKGRDYALKVFEWERRKIVGKAATNPTTQDTDELSTQTNVPPDDSSKTNSKDGDG